MPANRRINYTVDPSRFDSIAHWESGQPARDAVMREKFGDAAVARGYNTGEEYKTWRARDARADMWKNVGRAAAFIGGPIAASYAIPALSGGGLSGSVINGGVVSTAAPTAPVVGTSAGMSAAPTIVRAAPNAGSLSRLSSIFNSPGMELGVGAGLSIYGQRQQNKSNDQARIDMQTANREALALQRQQLEAELRNADLDRADAKAANDALNELKRRELAASEEERAYKRGLEEQRETRLAPYRRQSEAALQRLSAIWGLR